LRLRTIFGNLALSDPEAYYEDLAWLKAERRQRLYRPEFERELGGYTPLEAVYPHYAGSPAVDPLGRSQYADTHVYMVDDVLVKVDRMSMAHALEVRSPLLDPAVFEFAAALPAEFKLRGDVGKLVLRELAKKRLPPAIGAARKRGFSVPSDEWLRQDLREYAHEAIFERSRIVRERLNPPETRRLWDEHQSGARNHGVILWGLMMLGLWEANYAA
jgi:asparagine synthase (glutamine-hydrolysing)